MLQVFATILAMITDEINNVMLAARSGKSPVVLSGHILLLNWNQQVCALITCQPRAARLAVDSNENLLCCQHLPRCVVGCGHNSMDHSERS